MIFLDCSGLSQEKSRVYRLREKGERKRKANKTFVFSCFIQLFSSFLFILKFIHFYLFSFFFFFFNGFYHTTQKKKKKRKWKSPKMISCCTIHLADIPNGVTRVSFDICGPTLRKFPFKPTLHRLSQKPRKAAWVDRSTTCQILWNTM